MHNADSAQLRHMITEVFTHTANLSVQSLSQDNAKRTFARLFHRTGTCHRVKNWDTLSHSPEKFLCDRAIDGDQIFLLMVVTGSHDLVEQVSLIGHKKQTFGILIQSSHRINPDRVVQVIRDRLLLPLLPGAAYNSAWLIK